MKRIFALLLFLCLLAGMLPAASAASGAHAMAQDLKSLGLFKGVSETDFALDRAPTRTEALVILIRVLGKEQEALSGTWSHPFTDVDGWADAYVGYAYENGLTKGVSATAFGRDNATCGQFVTFLLRALGYDDAAGDFRWDAPYELAWESQILPGAVDTENFLREDVVYICYAALQAKLKGSASTLAQKLTAAGVFTQSAFDAVYRANAIDEAADTVLTAEELFAQCSPAVFYIEVADAAGQVFASGSGFFLEADGVAVTNYHVIEGAASAKIRTQSGEVHGVSGVWACSKEEDWAILQIDGSGFPVLEPGSSVTTGQTVYAIGSPLGLQNTLSQGLVSTAVREVDGQQYIQISTPISGGSSGGALLDENGRVVGITSAGFTEGQNLNLAIPIAKVLNKSRSELTPLGELASATDLLRTFVEQNANYTFLEKYPAVALQDRRTTFVLYYDAEAALMSMNLTYSASSGAQLSVWLDLSPAGQTHEVAYYYYKNRFASDWSAAGVGSIQASAFSGSSAVSFTQYEGAAEDRTAHGELAASLVEMMVSDLDAIFKAYPQSFGTCGIHSFGF